MRTEAEIRGELSDALQMAHAAAAAELELPAARNYGWAAALAWVLEAPVSEALA